MKFFNIILISSYLLEHWASPYDAPETLAPSRLLYFQYSMLHSQLPKNADPNTSCPRQEILFEGIETCVPLTSLPNYLRSTMVDTLHEYEHDLYLQPPLIFVHSQNRISVLSDPCNASEYPPLIHDNDTWSPILYVLIVDLLNAISFYILPFSKSIKFLETKMPAIKLQGFNLSLRY
jgi:hypothetical protein